MLAKTQSLHHDNNKLYKLAFSVGGKDNGICRAGLLTDVVVIGHFGSNVVAIGYFGSKVTTIGHFDSTMNIISL